MLTPSTLRPMLERIAHLLPAQGPITAFVHHNTLHSFEEFPFEDGVERAAALYGCRPYLSEEQYRAHLGSGRISVEQLRQALRASLGETGSHRIAELGTREELRWAMLVNPVRVAGDAEVDWAIHAGDRMGSFRRRCPQMLREQMVADTRRWVMRRWREIDSGKRKSRVLDLELGKLFRLDRVESWTLESWEKLTRESLWVVCRNRTRGVPAEGDSRESKSVRDQRLPHARVGADHAVMEVLTRFCASFCDQGLASRPMPHRADGFLRAFAWLHRPGPTRILPEHMSGIDEELRQWQATGFDAAASVARSLDLLDVPDAEAEAFLTDTLLAMRGWAGMLWQLESRPDRVRFRVPTGTLLEFLAVRLVLDRLAGACFAKGSEASAGSSVDFGLHEAYSLFLVAQSMGWKPRQLHSLPLSEWSHLISEIRAFGADSRCRVFQRAYEMQYLDWTCRALSAHRPAAASQEPAFHAIFCLDEREESMRRHLEEVEPQCATWGVAGFFGVAMQYQGAWDHHSLPLCPVNILPRHFVREVVVEQSARAFRSNRSHSKQYGRIARGIHQGSRGLLHGIPTALLGAVSAIPLVFKVLFPHLTASLWRRTSGQGHGHLNTALQLKRELGETAAADGLQIGFTAEEMAEIVHGLLEPTGLAQHWTPYIVVVGHGSSSLNNPHEAAHDCGACGGGRGGPNARAFCQMANDPEVRALLAARGMAIPDSTRFIGAFHNTCDDSIDFMDCADLQQGNSLEWQQVLRAFETARRRNAQERCRRFHTAPLLADPEVALRHVENRATDLAQPRPEFGHASNAVAVVGRRTRTRSLFMDRRAFLISYDPEVESKDHPGAVLQRLLSSVVPVCAGINLEYFFSYMDPRGWGCGTKLPHNVTALLGVMDGSASDLRPGLPWQMVEIHEPMRLLLAVETAPETLERILRAEPALDTLVKNQWIRLASLDPESSQIQLWSEGGFTPYEASTEALPEVSSSLSWFGGLREHLDFAAIRQPLEAVH